MLRVLIEWGEFTDESYLDEISIDYEEANLKEITRGTRLTLSGLRKIWKEEDYEELHARLSRLISPFNDVEDFEVILEVPGFPQLSGAVEPPELVLKPRYLLRGNLDRNGRFGGEWSIDGKKEEKLSNLQLGGEGRKPLCGPFEVEIRAWDRDQEGLEPISQRD